MLWNEFILEQFATAIPLGEHDESEYHGPYNTLLAKLFPAQEHYMVAPQFKRPRQLESDDFTTIFFLIQWRKHPVFFVEIEAAGHIHNDSSRAAADQQMRERVNALRNDIEIPILYGVSAIGTKLCFYKYTKDSRKLEPKLILGDTEIVIDTAPRERWDVDILTDEGERKFRDVIGDVKRMCEQMGQASTL